MGTVRNYGTYVKAMCCVCLVEEEGIVWLVKKLKFVILLLITLLDRPFL